MQSDNEKMLQEIVQNTEMGKNTLDELMSLTHDQKLRDEMLRQKREYRRINQAAHTALDAIGAEAHGQSAAARMSVSMGIRTRTMMDKSTRNLATMLAEGSGQGVLDCKRAERDYPEASPGAFKLCHELGAFQSDAEETWRGFVYGSVVGAAHVRPAAVWQTPACGKAEGRACPAPTVDMTKTARRMDNPAGRLQFYSFKSPSLIHPFFRRTSQKIVLSTAGRTKQISTRPIQSKAVTALPLSIQPV